LARDDHPRHRRARKIERRTARRETFDRMLIVTEGEQTEVNYFEEIRRECRVSSAVVRVCASDGTNPMQVVDYAAELCGRTRQWERVYAVIDRDNHARFNEALAAASRLDGSIRNDEKKPIAFKAVPSNPCFELWLLIHFQRSEAHIHRDDVFRLLARHIDGYRKGSQGLFAATKPSLDIAYENAKRLRDRLEQPAQNPSTDVDLLVRDLVTLRDEK
jgi:hypothetical protein